MNKKINKIIGIFVLFMFLSPPVFSFLPGGNLYNESSYEDEVRTSATVLDTSSLSVPWGTDVMEGVNYDFVGVFVDTSDDFRFWTDDASLETEFILEPTIGTTYPISVPTNNETSSSLFPDDVTMTDGEIRNNWLDSYEGHYAGTYSFTDDTVGGDPVGWSVTETGGTVNVLEEAYGHKKVVEMVDDDAVNRVYLTNTFDNQEYGTIEFLFYAENTQNVYVAIYDGGSSLHYVTLKGHFNGEDISTDNWHQIRIDFECTDGGYMGLEEDTITYYLDGQLTAMSPQPMYSLGHPYANGIQFYTWTAYDSTQVYIDAVGYSWDPDYEPGNNLYYDYTVFESTDEGYDYDYADRVTYEYEIWEADFNSNPQGAPFEFLGEYSFTDDTVGGDPSGWTVDEDGGTIQVIESLGGHEKVVELHDTVGNIEVCSMINSFTEIESGIYEIWVRQDSNSKLIDVNIMDGSVANDIHFAFFNDGNLKYYDGDWYIIQAYSADTWYHLRFEFDCLTDWHLWINGVSMDGGAGYAFRGAPVKMDGVRIATSTQETNQYVYVDAVDFSWSDDYYVGRNLHYKQYESIGSPYDYFGTESFTNEVIGTTGTDIEFVDHVQETESNMIIVNNVYGHKKVVKVTDSTGSWNSFYNNITRRTSGTVEVWMLGTDVSADYTQVWLMDDGLPETDGVITFGIDGSNNLYYTEYGDASIEIGEAFDNIWYHFRVDFYSDNTYDLYLDGNVVTTGEANWNDMDNGVNRIRFRAEDSTGLSYFDAIGYSWDSDYEISENLYYEETDYLGEYSFTEESIDTHTPTDWAITVQESTEARIVDYAGHSKVIMLRDDWTSGKVTSYNEFSNVEFGTIEAWIYVEDVSEMSDIVIERGALTTNILIWSGIRDSQWFYYTTSAHNIAPAYDNTWYHVRFDFECGAGGYEGLAAHTFFIWIDGIKFGPYPFFNVGMDYCDAFGFLTQSPGIQTFYVDAIDYSWSEGYYTNRNTNKRLYEYYLGEYTFVDEMGSGTAISLIDVMGAGYTAEIVSSYEGHNNVLHVERSGAFTDYPYDIIDDQTSGTIEFWVNTDDDTICINLLEDDDDGRVVSMNYDAINNEFDIFHAATFTTVSNIGGWTHVKIYFSSSSDTQTVWVNGVCIVRDVAFYLSRTIATVNRVVFPVADGGSVYYDAVDYSWSDGYFDGRNKEVAYYSGIYPGTYTFTNDTNGQVPTGWTDESLLTGYVQVVPNYNGHDKVLSVVGLGGSDDGNAHNTFSGQTSGTIEFWWISEDATLESRAFFREGGTELFTLKMNNDQFKYYDGSDHVVAPAYDDVWYHIRVDFDCATDTYDFYINDTLVKDDASFINTGTQLDIMYFNTNAVLIAYFDAVDYSWTDGYFRHRNVFMERQDIDFHGAYSFKDDTVGGDPSGWTIDEDGGAVNIVASKYGHGSVLELYDNNPTDGVTVLKDFDLIEQGDIDNTIEFWWGYYSPTSQTLNHYARVNIYSGDNRPFHAYFNYQNQGTIRKTFDDTIYATGLSDQTLHHIKIIFDDTTQTFEFFVDGVSTGVFPFYETTTGELTSMYVYTRASNAGGEFWHWFDAIDYSGSDGYYVGRNMDYSEENFPEYMSYYSNDEFLFNIDDYNVYLHMYNPWKLVYANLDYQGNYSFTDIETEQGVYYGTYDFRDELGIVGGNSYFTAFDDAADCEIVDEVDGHKYVMNYSDDAGHSSLSSITEQVSGYVEYWIYQFSGTSYWRIRDPVDNHHPVALRHYTTKVRIHYGDGVGGSTYIEVGSVGWTHIKAYFDCVTDKQSIWVNGVLELDNENFDNDWDKDSVGYTVFYSPAAFELAFDAIGYSWDTASHDGLGYEVGYNINPYDIEPLLNSDFADYLEVDFDCEVSITDYLIHNNVLNLTDYSSTSNVEIQNNFTIPIVSGSVEWWISTDYNGRDAYMMFYSGDTVAFGVRIYGGSPQVYDGDWHYMGEFSLSVGYWHYMEFIFDCETDTYDFYLLKYSAAGGAYPSKYEIEDYSFATDVANITSFKIYTDVSDSDFSYYFDAIDYSWTEEYFFQRGRYDVQTMENFYGEYSFTNETTGTSGTDISFIDSMYGSFMAEIRDFANHKNVLYFGSTVENDYGTPVQWTEQSSGTVEFWTIPVFDYYDNYEYEIIFRSGTSIMGIVRCRIYWSSVWRYKLGAYYGDGVGGSSYSEVSVSRFEMGHVRVSWDCDTDTYSVWIDGVLILDNLNFYNDNILDTVDNFYIKIIDFGTYGTTGCYGVLDAVDYSWSEGYYLGRNLYSNSSEYQQISIVYDAEDLSSYESQYGEFHVSSNYVLSDVNGYEVVNDEEEYQRLFITYNILSNGMWYTYQNTASTENITKILVDNNLDSLDGLRITYTLFGCGSRLYLYDVTLHDRRAYIPTELDFTASINVDLISVYEYLLHTVLLARYYTSIHVPMNFSIYNYEDSQWELINSSIYINGFVGTTFTETTDCSDYAYNGQFLVRFQATHEIYEFDFYLQTLNITNWQQLILSCEVSLDLLGLWKYRFLIPEDGYTGDWIYFDVVEKYDTFQAMSDSSEITRWVMQDSVVVPSEDFHDDITDTWTFESSITEDPFLVWPEDYGNYIQDESVYEETYYYKEPHPLSGDRKTLDILWDGTNFWVFDEGGELVQKYSSSFGYLGAYSVSGVGQATGIEWDGTNFWVSYHQYRSELDYVRKYSSSWSLENTYYIDLMWSDVSNDIIWDGTDFWLIDRAYNKAYKYSTSWVYSGTSQSLSELMDYGFYDFETDSFLICQTGVGLHNYTSSWSYVGLVVSWGDYRYGATMNGDNIYVTEWDYFNPDVFEYQRKYSIQKTDQSSGEIFMQTDQTDTMSITSGNYGLPYSFSSGDSFILDFKTTSNNEITLTLLNDDTITGSYVISESGNSDFSRRIIDLVIEEDVTFDQLKISGSFEDTMYFILYDIKSENYDAVDNLADFYVNADSFATIFLQKGDYTLRIYEEGILKSERNVLITTYEILYSELYSPIETIGCRLTIFSQVGTTLTFTDFHVNVTKTLNNVTESYWLVETAIVADESTSLIIEVYDRFDSYITTFTKDVNYYIDIELDVYLLKIKNEAEEYIDYTLTNDNTGTFVSGLMFSRETLEYMLATDNYTLYYVNHEDDFPRTLEIEFTENELITIDTTYHQVYFSMFTYDGLGLDRDLVRFYINDERKDFGFNSIQSETANLIVKDFFNNTMANETIDASAYSEYNIFVEIYSLVILNQFTYEDIVVNITQVGSNVWMTQIIPKQFGLTYRFLPNVEYNMTIFFTNETLYTSRIVNLTTNSHIESFGVPTGIPEFPKDVYFSVYTGTGLSIQQQLLKFYIDGDRADFGFNTIEDAIITLTVKDFFNTTLFNQIINVTGIYEYDISINIYSLKVKNEGQMVMNYTLNRGSLTDTGNILPDEIIEYQLSIDSYIFEYTNQEDDSSGSISFTLNEDKVYILNSTYYNIYLSIFDTTGTLNWENVKFYINDTRSDFGFNTFSTDYMNLKVLDYFNSTLFDQDVLLRGLNEYNIFVTLYSFKIQNQAEEVANYTLTLGSVTESKDILPNEIIEYLLASGTYTFEYINQEDDSYHTDNIVLTDNVVYVINTTYYNVYISIFDTTRTLNWENVKFYINDTRSDFGFNTFSTDYMNLKVLDYFNSTLFDQDVLLRGLNEYNIFVTLYSFKIQNQAEEVANYTLTLGSVTESKDILPNEIIEYLLASGTYTFEYVNQEDDSYHIDSIVLTDNVVYSINTTYHDVYIGLYNFYGIVNMEEVRFYINDTRADFGFNTMKSDYINLKVLDFFNSTLYDETVYLKDLKEYSIFISAYTLIVNNEYNTQSIKIKITRGGISVERIIESQGFTEFKLYANLKYYIVAYDLNDTVVDHTDVVLDEEFKTVDFGFYQADVTVDPTPIINTYANMVWVIVFIVIILLAVAFFYYRVSRKYNRVPAEVKNRYRKRKTAPNRKTSYSQNIID